MTVAIVVPVYRNEATLTGLRERLARSLEQEAWRLRLVVDASPDRSLEVARALAEQDPRVRVTALPHNIGQHAALRRGLAAEPRADRWVCLDGDLQDPPEAVPALLDRLGQGDVEAVFAGRRGHYERAGRLATGRLHRTALARITGLPADAGAFVALRPAGREAVLALGGPSVVAAIGIAGVPTATMPVTREVRPAGETSWTSAARLRQSARTLLWAARRRSRAG
jgi:glycosyltransferase involved in cell wall biosynthesis